ncbi:alpha-xenorhabdolysin family binary toxin subunit A [Pseudomonas sp. NPDC089392]|uniref:alpha-xenorhabdolysin family binary toxin subunit A n=1 Tax=Pseudomonas sp. NPDC089392 TaxID=3364459 RepID=UPI00380EE9AD
MSIAAEQEGVSIDEMDLAGKVKVLPERYFAFIGSRLSSGQQVGNLLTAENLKVIKQYVNTVNQLPRSREEIDREVDYVSLGIDASLVHDLYMALHRHVHEWDKLERSIKQLGPEIELFADSLVQRGGALLDNLERSEAFQQIKRRKAEQGSDIYSHELTDDEREQITAVLSSGMNGLIREIEYTRRRICEVDERASWFNSEVRRELKPRMGRLLKHFDEKLANGDVLEKRQQLDQWDEEIDLLKAEYDANVGYAFTGLVLGPVGLLVTGGVFGAKAEQIRAVKNELIKQRSELARALGRMEPARKDFECVSTLVRDLQFRCKDLSAATKRLADVWLFLASYATNSVNEAKELSNISQLESFVHDFSEVINPWSKIGSICHTLSELFNELIEEYEDA